MAQGLVSSVSIGVPTFNRPDGLRRTLACLTAQTHRQLDILVSDNCSPSGETARVAAEFSERDNRIRFVRQSVPLGVAENFRYVLQESNADYFMWAADDDEWNPAFIERCLAALQSGAASAMSDFETHYRASGKTIPARLPVLDPGHSVASNMAAFLHCLTPSLIYGLHRRSAIGFFLEDEYFDYYDCYFILRLLASGGIALVPQRLYVAGIDASAYVVKPMHGSWGSGLRYIPFYRAARRVIADAPLSRAERFRLDLQLKGLIARLFSVNEGRAMLNLFR